MRRKTVVILAVLAILGPLGRANALILANKSPEQKFRRNVARQLSKYVLCLTKAAQKCEATGVTTAVECHLDTGIADAPADPKGKFGTAVTKCTSKVKLAKKSPSKGLNPVGDYEGIGCPGDTDGSNGNGDQRWTDFSAYAAGAVTQVRTQIGAIAGGIDLLGCANGSNHTDATDLACVTDNALKIGVLVKGVFKCGDKCQNDYKNKIGNGGTTDAANCTDGGEPAFQICIDAARAKATKKGPFDPDVEDFVLPLVSGALTEAGADIYDEDDCGP